METVDLEKTSLLIFLFSYFHRRFGDHLIKFHYIWKKVGGPSETYIIAELVEHLSYAQ